MAVVVVASGHVVVEPVAREGSAQAAEQARHEPASASSIASITGAGSVTLAGHWAFRADTSVGRAGTGSAKGADHEKRNHDHHADHEENPHARTLVLRSGMGFRNSPSPGRDGSDRGSRPIRRGPRCGTQALGDGLDAGFQPAIEVAVPEVILETRHDPLARTVAEKVLEGQDPDLFLRLRDQDKKALSPGVLGVLKSHLLQRLTFERRDRLDDRGNLVLPLIGPQGGSRLLDRLGAEKPGAILDVGLLSGGRAGSHTGQEGQSGSPDPEHRSHDEAPFVDLRNPPGRSFSRRRVPRSSPCCLRTQHTRITANPRVAFARSRDHESAISSNRPIPTTSSRRTRTRSRLRRIPSRTES